MTCNSFQFYVPFSALVAGCLLGLCAAAAQADVTLLGRQTIRTGQSAPVAATEMLCYQGSNTRLETLGEPTLIYDGKANILYGVNTARRSYAITVPVPPDPTDEISLGADEVKIETTLDLHRTSLTRTLAGLAAHQYLVSGTVLFTRLRPAHVQAQNDQEEEREREGRRRRDVAFVAPVWAIRGEIWLADARKFPSKENTLLASQLVAVSAGPFEDPLADALDKYAGLPLLAQVTVTHVPARLPPVPVVTVTLWNVQSVSDAPLAPKLFQVPLAYALVAAPLTPYAPGRLAPAAP